MLYWRTTEKTSWADRVTNDEVLKRVNEERDILHTIKRKKANWIGHILHRHHLLKTLFWRKDKKVRQKQKQKQKKKKKKTKKKKKKKEEEEKEDEEEEEEKKT
jgi:hypothetical protein